jgi:hypothetical protein
VPLNLTWGAPTDVPANTASLLYTLETSSNAGTSWAVQLTVTNNNTAAAGATPVFAASNSRTVQFAAGSSTQVRVKVAARDAAGATLATSAYTTAPALTPAAEQETSTAIAYSPTTSWTAGAVTGAWGGWVNSANQATTTTSGPSATYSFTGTQVSWVSTKGADRGKASVSVDGGAPTTVDLYSATVTPSSVVFARSGLIDGPHTIKITLLGTHNTAAASTSPNRVDVDSFIVLP